MVVGRVYLKDLGITKVSNTRVDRAVLTSSICTSYVCRACGRSDFSEKEIECIVKVLSLNAITCLDVSAGRSFKTIQSSIRGNLGILKGDIKDRKGSQTGLIEALVRGDRVVEVSIDDGLRDVFGDIDTDDLLGFYDRIGFLFEWGIPAIEFNDVADIQASRGNIPFGSGTGGLREVLRRAIGLQILVSDIDVATCVGSPYLELKIGFETFARGFYKELAPVNERDAVVFRCGSPEGRIDIRPISTLPSVFSEVEYGGHREMWINTGGTRIALDGAIDLGRFWMGSNGAGLVLIDDQIPPDSRDRLIRAFSDAECVVISSIMDVDNECRLVDSVRKRIMDADHALDAYSMIHDIRSGDETYVGSMNHRLHDALIPQLRGVVARRSLEASVQANP